VVPLTDNVDERVSVDAELFEAMRNFDGVQLDASVHWTDRGDDFLFFYLKSG